MVLTTRLRLSDLISRTRGHEFSIIDTIPWASMFNYNYGLCGYFFPKPPVVYSTIIHAKF